MATQRILLGWLAAAAVMVQLGSGHAQDGGRPTAAPVAPDQSTGTYLTLKERLSDKASDEQRVDNCGVPVERRGSKQRPEGCKADAAGGPRPQPR